MHITSICLPRPPARITTTVMLESEQISLPDGRTLCYAIYGVAKPLESELKELSTVFYFHGYPGSHYEGRTFHECALKYGIRFVSISRPGMGGSTYQPNRTLLDISSDVLCLADHLRVRRFAVVGLSGGGPYALACAYAIPASRLLGTVVLSGLYPAKLGMSGVVLQERLLFTVAPWLKPSWVAKALDSAMGSHARDTSHPERYAKAVAEYSKSPEDQEALHADDGKLLKVFVDSTRSAFQQSSDGCAWEARLYGSRWGFELQHLKVEPGKLVLWHGARDDLIPVKMAEKAAGLIPNSILIVKEDVSHLSLCTREMDQIMVTLVGMFST
ncbi:Alpha/Beta hydrolase protein [Xylariales sp. PMI_506]|nr:Alpha/Beta hydrolase protein [Xylariales sp. PMI_506]